MQGWMKTGYTELQNFSGFCSLVSNCNSYANSVCCILRAVTTLDDLRLITTDPNCPSSYTYCTKFYRLLEDGAFGQTIKDIAAVCIAENIQKSVPCLRGELSYLAPLGSEKISAPYFKQCFFPGGVLPHQTESNTTPPSPKTEITNILFYILNFASIIKFKM